MASRVHKPAKIPNVFRWESNGKKFTQNLKTGKVRTYVKNKSK